MVLNYGNWNKFNFGNFLQLNMRLTMLMMDNLNIIIIFKSDSYAVINMPTYLPWCCSHPLHHHKSGRAESLACADLRVRTPIGVSVNLFNVLDKKI
jgi:hypothetical protein